MKIRFWHRSTGQEITHRNPLVLNNIGAVSVTELYVDCFGDVYTRAKDRPGALVDVTTLVEWDVNV